MFNTDRGDAGVNRLDADVESTDGSSWDEKSEKGMEDKDG